jgi:hypothetical protein
LFFSEEKNQKTFIFWRLHDCCGYVTKAGAGGKRKSLFGSFSSEKEHLTVAFL